MKDEKEITSRREAIAKGVEEVEEKEKEVKEEPKEEKEVKIEVKELNEEETKEAEAALNLYTALKDPEAGPEIIRFLASKHGIKIEEATKSDEKKVTRTIKDIVKEELGSDFTVLSDKLGTILEKVVPNLIENSVKSLKEESVTAKQTALKNEISNALDNAFSKYEDVPKKVQTKLSELMDDIPPIPGKTDPKKYFDRMLSMAASEVGVKLVSKEVIKDTEKINEKRERNKRDASSRLASDGAAEVNDGKGAPPEIKSRRQAIEEAMKRASTE